MKPLRIWMFSALVLITSCVSVERPNLHCVVGDRGIAEVLSSEDGKWYGLRRTGEYNYETEDCVFERMGNFSCLIFDNSCSGIACDGQSYSITGIWKVENSQLIRKNASGFGRKIEISDFSCASFREISFQNGSRLYKKRWRRDADV
jgi:hypothetical protein